MELSSKNLRPYESPIFKGVILKQHRGLRGVKVGEVQIINLDNMEQSDNDDNDQELADDNKVERVGNVKLIIDGFPANSDGVEAGLPSAQFYHSGKRAADDSALIPPPAQKRPRIDNLTAESTSSEPVTSGQAGDNEMPAPTFAAPRELIDGMEVDDPNNIGNPLAASGEIGQDSSNYFNFDFDEYFTTMNTNHIDGFDSFSDNGGDESFDNLFK